jgi:hypothetical protein
MPVPLKESGLVLAHPEKGWVRQREPLVSTVALDLPGLAA